jgi:hypothetical protein
MRITKNTSEKFNKAIEDFIISLGGYVWIKEHFRTVLLLETVAGTMSVALYEQNICYAVYCRFMDVAEAKEKFTCNKYSGKYNLYIAEPLKIAIEKTKEHIETTQN